MRNFLTFFSLMEHIYHPSHVVGHSTTLKNLKVTSSRSTVCVMLRWKESGFVLVAQCDFSILNSVTVISVCMFFFITILVCFCFFFHYNFVHIITSLRIMHYVNNSENKQKEI